MSDISDQIKELNDKIGPRRVKTEGVETEDHDIKSLAAVARTMGTVKPTFGNFMYTKVVPNGCSCEENP